MFTFDMHTFYWLLLSLLVLTTEVHAKPLLYVKPEICIREQNSQCNITMKAFFEDSQKRAVCFSIPQIDYENCPTKDKLYVVEVQVQTEESLNIAVLDAATRTVISQAVLNVAIFKPEATRKRRRFSWSF